MASNQHSRADARHTGSDRLPPWAAEVSPNTNEIVATLRADLPMLALDRVVRVGEGWNSYAYLVDDRWLFRFPKRNDVQSRLATEVRLLPMLARHLPVAVPRFTHVVERSARYPFLYAGYEKMAGVFAWDLDLTERNDSALVRSCSDFLEALHSIPPDEARACGCREQTTRTTEDLARRIRETLARIPGWEERSRYIASIERYLASLSPGELIGPPALKLVHSDLLPDHLLLEEPGLELRGVIDWGEARIDDPAWDFAGLVYWRGMPFVREVLTHYGGEDDPALTERARLIALEIGLGDVWYGLDGGARAYFEVGVACLDHCLADA